MVFKLLFTSLMSTFFVTQTCFAMETADSEANTSRYAGLPKHNFITLNDIAVDLSRAPAVLDAVVQNEELKALFGPIINIGEELKTALNTSLADEHKAHLSFLRTHLFKFKSKLNDEARSLPLPIKDGFLSYIDYEKVDISSGEKTKIKVETLDAIKEVTLHFLSFFPPEKQEQYMREFNILLNEGEQKFSEIREEESSTRENLKKDLESSYFQRSPLWYSLITNCLGIHIHTSMEGSVGGSRDTFKDLRDNLNQRQLLWGLLREQGLIDTQIQDPCAYNYNAGAHLAMALEKKPDAPVIIGCGNHGGRKSFEIAKLGRFACINCGACSNSHSDHITINVDPSQMPTLLADALDLDLWRQQGSDSVSSLLDESYYYVFFRPETLSEELFTELFRVLKPGGLFTTPNGLFSIESETLDLSKSMLQNVGFTILNSERDLVLRK